MPSPLVILGMSGGVDSSVAAHLLLQQGYRVEGLFMTNWEEDEDGYCTAAADYQDARKVAELFGIPLHKVNFATQYRERVFQHFLDEYSAGRTPNPDVLCNREIKFGVCFEYAMRLGADFIATGHYARVDREPHARLLKGLDAGKDQSYFLAAISRARYFLLVSYRRAKCGALRNRSLCRCMTKKTAQEFALSASVPSKNSCLSTYPHNRAQSKLPMAKY